MILLPFRKHVFWWFSLSFSQHMLTLILDEFWHRCWLHFSIPLASNSMFWGDLFWYFGESEVYWFMIRNISEKHSREHHFRCLFRFCSASGVFEGSLAHFGSLLVPFLLASFGSCWVSFLIHFELAFCFLPKNMFLSTQDRESTVDSCWHPHRSNPRRSTSSF